VADGGNDLEPDVTELRLAYVSAEYPKVSHTFIAREVDALRRRGAVVDTVTVRRTPPSGLLSDADREEDRRTFAILPTTPGRVLSAHAAAAARAPARYLRTLARALGGGPPGLRNRLWQLFYFAEAGLLAEELRRRGTQHLHAHFVNVAASVTQLASALLGPRVRWSFTMHGPLEFDNVDQHGIADKVRDAAFVVCISDFARSQLMRLVEPEHWDKLHVVRCGVRPADYAGEPSAPNGAFRVLTVGRLAPMKGFAVLLDAVGRLVGQGRDVRLSIVGDGPDAPALEARARALGIADRVVFRRALGAPEVAGELRQADAFCLPSFAEGVPVVLMEAMAAGLPVVATRVMGVPELVRDGESGLLVAPGRDEPLAQALATLAADPQRRREMGHAGRRIVSEQFDVDRSAEALMTLFANGATR
jgi:glycosyltransferase involved in cell wall biosynthesis